MRRFLSTGAATRDKKWSYPQDKATASLATGYSFCN